VTALIDTSVMIDVLRGQPDAVGVLQKRRRRGPLHACVLTRLEVLAGMRANEEAATRSLLTSFTWHDVDDELIERAGALGRRWLPSHGGIGAVDLAIAATARRLDAELLTTNVRHFPMFPNLAAPY